jgi:flagellar hook-length control protein FliK
MTVPKTNVGGVTPPTQPKAETEATSAKGGEFDAVLDEKDVKGSARKKGARLGPVGTEGRRSTDGQGRTEDRASRGRTGAPETGRPEPRAREAAAEQALRDADLMARGAPREGAGAPAGTFARPGSAGGAMGADAAGATDAAARVERIAEQILLAAEVRLHGDGAVEARLQLDLGRLGRLHVALERTAEGQIRVALEPMSAEARDLLQARGQDLAHRLEARGLKLQELTVKSSGETVLHVEGAGKETTETVAARPAAPSSESVSAEPAAGREPAQEERFDEEHERRDRRERHEFEPASEEEEE